MKTRKPLNRKQLLSKKNLYKTVEELFTHIAAIGLQDRLPRHANVLVGKAMKKVHPTVEAIYQQKRIDKAKAKGISK